MANALKRLETERLFIRINSREDYLHVFNTLKDDAIKEYMGLNDEELEMQKEKIKGGMNTYRTSFMIFQLIKKDTNKIIGSCSFHNWYPMHRRAEIGYAMRSEEYQNKGLMQEAAKSIIEYGFGFLELNRIEALIHPDNVASRRIVENLGFSEEGLLKEHYIDNGVLGDSVIYRLLQKEHAQNNI